MYNELTAVDIKKMKEEIKYRATELRPKLSDDVKEARSLGDLSENAEYDAAKNEQAELEERIHRLETMMRNAKIINEDEVTGEYVNVGLRVTVEDVDSKESMDFIIVGSTEADPFAEPAKISNESEVGKNLLGKKIGETVEITVPDGILHYRVTAISKE